MGKVISRLNKQFYRFNAENRAHKEISREKLIPAPRHPSTEKAMETILEETQHLKEQALVKDPALDDNLRKVFVVSHDGRKLKPSERSQLPQNRRASEETELGYQEPQVVPRGKVTLLQVMRFLGDHQGDPHLFNAERISKEYNLSKEHVDNMLEYYGSFKIHVNEEDVKRSGLKDQLLSHFPKRESLSGLLTEKKEDVQAKPNTREQG